MYLHFIHLNGIELAFYLLKLFLKTILKAIVLDFKYSKSFWMFISSIKLCLDQKKRFRELQKAKNVNLTIKDVVTFVNESNKDYPIVIL